MGLQQLYEPPVREDSGMQPPGIERVATAEVGHRVSKPSRPQTDVGQGEGLPSHGKGHDVVPTRQVLCRHEDLPARAQHPVGLVQEVVRVREVLDYLVARDEIDRLGTTREPPVKVRADGKHVPLLGFGRRLLGALEAQQRRPRGGITQDGRAVPATQVENYRFSRPSHVPNGFRQSVEVVVHRTREERCRPLSPGRTLQPPRWPHLSPPRVPATDALAVAASTPRRARPAFLLAATTSRTEKPTESNRPAKDETNSASLA